VSEVLNFSQQEGMGIHLSEFFPETGGAIFPERAKHFPDYKHLTPPATSSFSI